MPRVWRGVWRKRGTAEPLILKLLFGVFEGDPRALSAERAGLAAHGPLRALALEPRLDRLVEAL
eukprot:845855-Heterocapsa_arctica.AAC.1